MRIEPEPGLVTTTWVCSACEMQVTTRAGLSGVTVRPDWAFYRDVAYCEDCTPIIEAAIYAAHRKIRDRPKEYPNGLCPTCNCRAVPAVPDGAIHMDIEAEARCSESVACDD